MNRRFALKGLLGGLFAPKVVAIDPFTEVVGQAYTHKQVGVGFSQSLAHAVANKIPGEIASEAHSVGSSTNERWRLFDKLARRHRSDFERKLYENAFFNGMPIRVATNRSWSPSYKAIASAKIVVRERYKNQSIIDSLHKKAFGE